MSAPHLLPRFTAYLAAFTLLGVGCPSPAPGPVGDDDDAANDDDAADDDDDDAADDDDSADGDPWDAVRDAIDSAPITDLTVLIGTAQGPQFSFSKGDSSPTDAYLIASASKWLSSLTLLAAVDEGLLTLGDRPQDHLSWWTDDPSDPRSEVTLEQLLSFTSGFAGGEDSVPCVEDPDSTLDACAQTIYADFFEHEPGTTFIYGPSHLQVAGAMVSAATGDRFNRVFRDRIATPLGLASTTAFAVPSLDNPRVAGGATASAEDYGTILTALVSGQLLSPASMEVLGEDHTGAGVTMAVVPNAATVNGEWHYALGCWRECGEDPYSTTCDEPGVLSSPGAFGFYPWWDIERGFWGVLAIQLVQAGGGAGTTVPLGQQWAELAAEALGR